MQASEKRCLSSLFCPGESWLARNDGNVEHESQQLLRRHCIGQRRPGGQGSEFSGRTPLPRAIKFEAAELGFLAPRDGHPPLIQREVPNRRPVRGHSSPRVFDSPSGCG